MRQALEKLKKKNPSRLGEIIASASPAVLSASLPIFRADSRDGNEAVWFLVSYHTHSFFFSFYFICNSKRQQREIKHETPLKLIIPLILLFTGQMGLWLFLNQTFFHSFILSFFQSEQKSPLLFHQSPSHCSRHSPKINSAANSVPNIIFVFRFEVTSFNVEFKII